MGGNREPQRLRETIQAIKEVILVRGLKPGDPMPTETQLIEEIGVSRGSLREAVRTLSTLDILEVRHGTGTFVGQMSLRPLVEGLTFKGVVTQGEDDYETLRQVVEVRMALDLALAPRMVDHIADLPVDALRDLCDAMADKVQTGESFAAEDREFHLRLSDVIGNALYGELVAAFWDIHTVVGPRLGIATPRDLADTVAAHRAMLDTAEARDLEGYRAAVLNHYAPLLRVLDRPASAAS